jgi:c-di-GMP-binding flagellar brake protein YcgR
MWERNQFPAAQQTQASSDRRAFVRVPYLKPVIVTVPPDRRKIEASSLNISLGGVGLACQASFRKGQVLVVTFRLSDPKRGVVEESVTGRVMNLVADSDGNRVGVEFVEPLQHSTFPALVRAVERL